MDRRAPASLAAAAAATTLATALALAQPEARDAPRRPALAAPADVARAARAAPDAGDDAAADARRAVLTQVRRIDATMRFTRYTHAPRVDARAGSYEFDCSSMTAWVLARAAPRAQSAVARRAAPIRPLARDYYHAIAGAPAGAPADGWVRVARVSDARPGDVIAWLRPRAIRSANTGHVGFVVARPVALADPPGAYLVRIADASAYRHERDSRAGTGRTGFGFGTILVGTDPRTGEGRAIGWIGRHSPAIHETSVAVGRPVE